MDFELARFNMIEQQIRPWDVLDQAVLNVLASTPRENFVPERYRQLAFTDMNIPLGQGEVMMAPKVEGRLLQALRLQSGDSVLEIGTGSGYLTACLARLARSVLSVDIHPEFPNAALPKLATLGINNVEMQSADAANGWAEDNRFDAIAVTGSLPALHQGFHNALKIGGRLFVIHGRPPIMEALLITRLGKTEWAVDSLFEDSIPPLVHAERPRKFVF